MHLLAVIYLFPEVGYVTSKLRSHTIRQSLELCPFMQAYAWMRFPYSIFFFGSGH